MCELGEWGCDANGIVGSSVLSGIIERSFAGKNGSFLFGIDLLFFVRPEAGDLSEV